MKVLYSFLLSLAISFFFNLHAQSLTINEVLASNTSVNADEDGNYEDWIEIYNYGATSVSLNGLGLTDNPAVPFKWAFPNMTLNAGQYLLVWCSDKNRTAPGNPLHTNFKISASGEAVYLNSPINGTLSTVTAIALPDNISYGKSPNGTGSYFYFATPTPGLPNSTTTYSSVLANPTFSHQSGFYTTNFNLSLSTSASGATIIYTVDGSEPDPNNLSGTTYSYKNSYPELAGQSAGPFLQNSFRSFSYTAPIAIANRTAQPNKLAAMSSTIDFNPGYFPSGNIFKGTVVRAKVIKSGSIPSATVTKSFFVTPAGVAEFSLPVVSISLSENKFFDYTNGIFVAGNKFDLWRAANPTVNADIFEGNFDANFESSGDASERSGNISYLVNGTEVMNQDIGIRINGGMTRAWQSKSLRLVARSDYGNETMNYQFFSELPLTTFNRLILRNSGGDFIETMYRDAFAHELVKSSGIETQAYQPTVTFVNGEYWGILNLRERYDKYYFKNVYGFAENEVDLLEDDLQPEEGDAVHYQAMANYLENNSLAVQANYDYIKTQMDVENMRDYYIFNIYFDNTDWPGWNTMFWRKRTAAFVPNALLGHDGRWRAGMKDNDDCFGIAVGTNNHNNLAVATAPNGPIYPNPPFSTLILRSLLANTEFENNFINRFADLMNSYFLPSRFQSISNTMKARIQPEIQDHIDRWNATDYAWWEDSIGLMNAFGNERPAFQKNHIRSKFGITGSDRTITLDVSDVAQGFVKMNTIDILGSTPGLNANPYPWSGQYFNNVPVKIKAIPYNGYQFSHWSGASSSTNAEITLTPTANLSLTAHFSPSGQGNTPEILYFWMMNDAIVNDTPLTSMNSTYEFATDGVLQYQSCLAGYPFTSASPNWRKASLERRNNPTPINYFPLVNGNIAYENSNMRGLQVKQPFQSGNNVNTLIFTIPTTNHRDIKFNLALVDEGAATGVTIDYATNAGSPTWTSAGMSSSSFPISNTYQEIEANFTPIVAANDNANFKVRLRFTGPNMTADAGARITFNNVSVEGVAITLNTEEPIAAQKFLIYPNPVIDKLNIAHEFSSVAYQIFTLEGRKILEGTLENKEINLNQLASGVYLLRLQADGKTETKKFIKK
ncbi:CotH kinase family protein [Flavobacterium sp.]|uniref:CotH kinase family protein n=1 Tax=Flavobacterium sp. TaxID=239 RepID=UPI0028BE69CD|nr:CotH kinase family protein [Flavobacterium sp.]